MNWSNKVEYISLQNYKLTLIPAEASLDVNKCLERLWVKAWYCSEITKSQTNQLRSASSGVWSHNRLTKCNEICSITRYLAPFCC